jgi:hypothetical protein
MLSKRDVCAAVLSAAVGVGVSLSTAHAQEPTAPPPATHDHEAPPPAPQGPEVTQEAETAPHLVLHGFTNVDYGQTDDTTDPGGFQLGQFVLHMSSALGKKVSFFGETSFTAKSTEFRVEVERLILRYDVNDRLKISMGRYHTPINYWNTAFHHGLWLQTSIARPSMIPFGGTFEPVHFVGLLAEGTLTSAASGIGYNVGVGNGRGAVISRAGDAGDVNKNRAWLAKVFARPAAIYGVEFGGAIYHDSISAPGKPELRERISSAYVALARETPEIIAEFANVNHRDRLTGMEYNNYAFYVQAAYRFPQAPRFKPYYRFEKLDQAQGEPVLGLEDVRTSLAGLRFELTTFAALKAEYRHSTLPDKTINGVFAQAAWMF